MLAGLSWTASPSLLPPVPADDAPVALLSSAPPVMPQPVPPVAAPAAPRSEAVARRRKKVAAKDQCSGRETYDDAAPAAYTAAPAAEPQEQVRELETWRLVLEKSWAVLQSKGQAGRQLEQIDLDSQSQSQSSGELKRGQKVRSKGGWFGGRNAGKKVAEGEGEESGSFERGTGSDPSSGSGVNDSKLPKTFAEMIAFNCRLMDCNTTLVNLLQSKLDGIVPLVAQGHDEYLELEANLLSLRIHKEVVGTPRLNEFRMVLFASLRNIIGNQWDAAQEDAWSRMWESISQKLEAVMGHPAMYRKATVNLITGLSEEDKRAWGSAAFSRLFREVPESESYFKQNNERLVFIVGRAADMCSNLYSEPATTINASADLGLRHIMYQVNIKYFEPFVQCILKELESLTTDTVALDGFAWAFMQIAALLVRTIVEGNTPLIQAVLQNKPQKVRQALSVYPRKDRIAAVM